MYFPRTWYRSVFKLVKKTCLLTNKQLKTHRTVQLPMINAPTNAIDGGSQKSYKMNFFNKDVHHWKSTICIFSG